MINPDTALFIDKPTAHELSGGKYQFYRSPGDLMELTSPPPRSWIISNLRYATKPTSIKPTGLETYPLEQLLRRSREVGAFHWARQQDVFLTANWERPFSTFILKHPMRREFVSYIQRTLAGESLVELGVGTHASAHRSIFRRAFRIKSYQGLDQQQGADRTGDVLELLSRIPDNSTHLVAFGVLNEPLSMMYENLGFSFPAPSLASATRSHCEHEYVRRLTKEMYRVIPPGGVLFGLGLHSQGFEREMQIYLLKAGFRHDLRAYGILEGVSDFENLYDPFIMRKAEG